MSVAYLITKLQLGQVTLEEALSVVGHECDGMGVKIKAGMKGIDMARFLLEVRDVMEVCQGLARHAEDTQNRQEINECGSKRNFVSATRGKQEVSVVQ